MTARHHESIGGLFLDETQAETKPGPGGVTQSIAELLQVSLDLGFEAGRVDVRHGRSIVGEPLVFLLDRDVAKQQIGAGGQQEDQQHDHQRDPTHQHEKLAQGMFARGIDTFRNDLRFVIHQPRWGMIAVP